MTTKTVLRATIHVDGPWLIGDATGDGDRHTTPVRDTAGVPEVPTASLAGSLRHHFTERQPQRVLDLFGGGPEESDDGRLAPSRLRLLGTVVKFDSGHSTAIRTSTAVDAESGSARHSTLRTDEYVDATANIHVYMSADGPLDSVDLETIASWAPKLGRRRTNGWGQAQLVDLQTGTVDLTNRQHLLRWLADGGPDLIDTFLTTPLSPTGATHATELLRATFTIESGLHIGSGESTGDHEDPDTTTHRPAGIVTSDGTPLVPSSTWRGIIRSRCAFILRSIGCEDSVAEAAITWVFGDHRRRGMLTFHDTPIVPGSTNLSGPPPEAIGTAEHVAIDRITGGARSGLLFSEHIARGSVTLRISIDQPHQAPPWLSDLLRHVVHDIHDGYLGVGGRTTRGLGTLRLAKPDAVPLGGGITSTIVAASLPTQEHIPT